MKNIREVQINIPATCHVALKDMERTMEGWFCDSCNRHVLDLRFKSDEQILEFLQSGKNSGCGILMNDQTGRPIAPGKPGRSYYKYLIIALIFTIILKNQAAATRKDATEQVEAKKGPILRLDTSESKIKCRVMDGEEPMPFATIQIPGMNYSTFSDTAGNFLIPFPDSLKGKAIKIIIDYVGYSKSEFEISPVDSIDGYIFKMHQELQKMYTVGMMVRSEPVRLKPRLIERPKRFFRWLFGKH
jgi:hypothetical protein